MRSRMLRWFVPLFAVIAVVAAGAAAQAGTYTYTRSMTMSVKHVSDGTYAVSGTVTVTNPDSEYKAGECLTGKTVTLFVNGVPARTGTIGAAGGYSMTVHVKGSATLQTGVSADVGNTTHPFNHTCDPSRSKRAHVLGATVTSPPPTKSGGGGTAFTGSSNVIPLAGGALLLVLLGSGLLWVGRRGRAGSGG